MGRSFEALKASANFDRVLFDGTEFGTATEAGSPEEEDYLGLPGLLDPDQVAATAAQAPGGADGDAISGKSWSGVGMSPAASVSPAAASRPQPQARMSQRHRGRHQARLPRP